MLDAPGCLNDSLPEAGLPALLPVKELNLSKVVVPEKGNDIHGVADNDPLARQKHVLRSDLPSHSARRQDNKRRRTFRFVQVGRDDIEYTQGKMWKSETTRRVTEEYRGRLIGGGPTSSRALACPLDGPLLRRLAVIPKFTVGNLNPLEMLFGLHPLDGVALESVGMPELR